MVDLTEAQQEAIDARAVAIIDPDGDKLNAVTCFLDPHEAVEYLQWKRAKL